MRLGKIKFFCPQITSMNLIQLDLNSIFLQSKIKSQRPQSRRWR